MRIFKKLLALTLVLATLCAFLVPASAADTDEDRRKAVVETALAFHFKENMQYDSTDLSFYPRMAGGTIREHELVAPEEATDDNPVYTVCSSFCWECYYNALGFKITDRHYQFLTENIYKNPPEGMVVYQHDNADGNVEASIEEARKLLQPGDICVVCVTNSGHAMLFVGDVDGDGKDDIIHSSGSKYDMTSGRDAREEGGNILLQPADELIFGTGAVSFAKTDRWIIIRPLQAGAKDAAITPAARSRMKYSAMGIYRTVNTGAFGSTVTGDTLTYTITVKNNSKAPYSGLPVKETVPAGTELIKADGAKVDGKNLSWTLNVAPGESQTVSYDVKVTAKRGESIVAGDGMVDQIPSNVLTTPVGGKTPDAAKLAAVTAADLSGADTAVITAFYQKALGITLSLPTARDIQRDYFETKALGGQRLYVRKASEEPAAQMLVPRWLGGRRVHTDNSRNQILEPRIRDLQPGDCIVSAGLAASADNTQVFLYTGKDLLISDGKKITVGTDKEMAALLSKDFFVCLRPSLAYDDVTAVKAEAKLPFTDVKEGDWYYEFVKELYEKKIVSGMTETTFVPNGKLTYGQALKLIVCGLGKGEQAANGSHWASGYLKFAKDQKWLDKDVDLNGAISRLQFCRIAAKAKNLTAQPASNPFKDCADKDVLALVNAGIINGMSADTFAPDNTLTRAQISKIISGLIK